MPEEAEPMRRELPGVVSSFVGRKDQINEIQKRLGNARLVTLTGTGGTGKTRLAVEIAHLEGHRYPDGARWVELAALRDEDAALRAVAHAVGIRDQSAHDLWPTLLDHLHRYQPMLLVLDNCEHLVESVAGIVEKLLVTTKTLRVLATSREPLGITGESVMGVPPLTVPPQHEKTPKALVYESAQLLVERAEASAPGWTSSWPHIVSVCRKLEGLPLAIELAAVRLRSMSIQELDRRLDDVFGVLNRSDRSVRAHHKTMTAMVRWSYDLCTDVQKRMWARMSVFHGSADLAAVEQVCAGTDMRPDEVTDALADLVDRSLVETTADRSRYWLLEPIRQFGLGLLNDQELKETHAAHYLAKAEKSAGTWFGSDVVALLRAVRADMPNYRAALNHYLRREPRTALKLALDLARSEEFFFNGWLPEGRKMLERALAATPPEHSPERIGALAMLAWIMLCQGDQEGSRRTITEVTELGDAVPVPVPPIDFVVGVGGVFLDGELPRSLEMLSRARGGFAAMGPDCAGDHSLTLIMVGAATALLGDEDQARQGPKLCLDNVERAQEPWGITWAWWATAVGLLRFGSPADADELLRKALRRQREMGDRWGPPWSCEALAWTAAALGDAARAAQLLGTATTLEQLTGVDIVGLTPLAAQRAIAVDLVKAAMSGEDYERLYRLGAAITDYDEAICFALAERPAVRDNVLTRAEVEVANLVATGMSNKAVAAELVVSVRTVESHVSSILRKLGVSNRIGITLWVQQNPAD